MTIFIQFYNCGDPVISIKEDDYTPKIVIEGYLFPGHEVGILITKNFPLNSKNRVNKFELLIEDADAKITNESTEREFQLRFNPETFLYGCIDEDLIIEYGRTYRLEIEAFVNGQNLSASCETTIPIQGFEIVQAESSLCYRERDQYSNLKHFEIHFKRSKGIGFYAFSIMSLDASDSTYIYNNPYVENNPSEVNFFLNDLRVYSDWMQNLPIDPLQEPVISKKQLKWRSMLFYGMYEVIVYAGDENFKDFFLTHSVTQEIDGNFHEPRLHIQGDGIGVFASAIADTVYVEVLP